ncbi:MAG: phage baseplate assembly protein V [Ferruginibacter sp.]
MIAMYMGIRCNHCFKLIGLCRFNFTNLLIKESMEYLVVTELEIDGEKFNNFSSLTLSQSYHDHHKFTITFKLSDDFIVNADDVDQFIGKSTFISYKKSIGTETETVYEFYGSILEAQFYSTKSTYPEFILIGFSNTIKLEQEDCRSFVNKTFRKIIDEIIGNRIEYDIHLGIYEPIAWNYICQYDETAFHFLRDYSRMVGGNMHYDGRIFRFGTSGTYLIIDEVANYDLLSIKVSMRISPQRFSIHSYDDSEDKLFVSKESQETTNYSKNANFLKTESNNFFSNKPSSFSNGMHFNNQKMLDEIAQMSELARAADLQRISGTSYNPSIVIGRILRVIPPGGNYQGNDVDLNCESYLITKVEHLTEDGSKYINKFEGIPFSEGKTYVLDDNVSIFDGKFERRMAHPQLATVMDNDDPEKKGRVMVQSMWQKDRNETSNWIRVMTPDAGGGKGGAKNRGFVAIPEIGDQVMIDFEHGYPDYPFVLGGMFHGKSGGGGGSGNKIKSLTSVSGCTISLDGPAINIIDASGNSIKFSGSGDINIKSSDHITLECGGSSIKMTPGNIAIKAQRITIEGSTDAKMFSGEGSFLAQAGDVSMKGFNATVEGTTMAKLDGLQTRVFAKADMDINATGNTTVKGATVKINS